MGWEREVINRGGRIAWSAHYRDANNRVRSAGTYEKLSDAKRAWKLAEVEIAQGKWIDPKSAKATVEWWCGVWLAEYTAKHPRSARHARQAVDRILPDFGARRLSGGIRQGELGAWYGKLQNQGLSEHTVGRTYGWFKTIYTAATDDLGITSPFPKGRHKGPVAPRQKDYVITSGQLLALYDAMEPRYRAALLLAAYAGLRVGEISGLRVDDIDFLRGVIKPRRQHPDAKTNPSGKLKTKASAWPILISDELALKLSAHVRGYPSEWVLSTAGGQGQRYPAGLHAYPELLRDAFAAARDLVGGFPPRCGLHDLRHYFASWLIIDCGLDIKTVQHQMRHANATTTLNVYGHLFPDREEATRRSLAAILLPNEGAEMLSPLSEGVSSA